MIFKHSGTFGDLIYSLYAVKKMGGGTIALALHNIERCVAEYGYRPDEVDEAHRGRFTEQDFAILKPLLMRQDYINDVVVWDGTHDVDLDRFRGVLFRGFEGNYVQAMCMTHGLPFTKNDLEQTWLTADVYRKKSVVVNRTLRYRDMEVGDKKTVEIESDMAYGQYNEAMIQEVPKEKVPEGVMVGHMLQANTPMGPINFRVMEVNEESVKLDGNHPLAGKKLIFDLEVLEVK